jgi:aminoglycoside phosphotransferase (APT) family kinase protein
MDDSATRRPTERDAALAVRVALGAESLAVERFPTGICHYVYDVITSDGRRIVARLASAESARLLAGGVYWHERLRGVGAPLAALLAADLAPFSGFPYMLLERLPGQDLALVYEQMTHAQRHTLAAEIVATQRAVASLPRARGYGFARSYDDPNLRQSWLDVVLADLERSRQSISAQGVASVAHVERVRQRVTAIADYLRSVAPVAFLDDTTTKNVIVHAGRLSGIVDTDLVCFGDPLFTLALTRVALLAHRLDPDYADHWRELLALSAVQRQALAVYVAIFCVGFIAEIGQRYNRDEPPATDLAYLRHLELMLDDALASA